MQEIVRLRIDEAKEELLACRGDRALGSRKYGEIVDRLTAKWQVSESTAERAIRRARKELRIEKAHEEHELKKKEIRISRQEEEQRINNALATDNMLMEIITGKARIKKVFHSKGGLEEREVEPDFYCRIQAAVAYYKQHPDGGYVKQEEGEEPNYAVENRLKEDDDAVDMYLLEKELSRNDGGKLADELTKFDAEFMNNRNYANMTDEQVEWMMVEVNGYYPNLPLGYSEREVEERLERIKRWMEETPEGRKRAET